jgi:hypothetical protein
VALQAFLCEPVDLSLASTPDSENFNDVAVLPIRQSILGATDPLPGICAVESGAARQMAVQQATPKCLRAVGWNW